MTGLTVSALRAAPSGSRRVSAGRGGSKAVRVEAERRQLVGGRVDLVVLVAVERRTLRLAAAPARRHRRQLLAIFCSKKRNERLFADISKINII